jgi:hypothetical protein
MPTTATAAVSVFGFVVVVVDPSICIGSYSWTVLGRVPNLATREASHVRMSSRMRFNRRASVDAALSAVAIVKWSGRYYRR